MTEVERLLRERGNQQQWLAAKIGMTPAGLFKMLHETVYPTVRRVNQVADALGVNPDKLVTASGQWLIVETVKKVE